MMKRYDFDCYAFYDDARLTETECEDGDYVLYSDYAALEEIAKEQGQTILRQHEALAALREAVAWERECCQDIRPLAAWGDLYVRHGEDYVDGVADDLRAIQDAARAAVDALVGEG